MANAIADFLGVDVDLLLSDAGIAIMLVITASLIYIVFKCLFNWFNGFFNR